ncbi:MAG: cytochrome c biogenesis heme-transporting ATPase CcmA [Pseudohongiellaceae bacterium]
MRQSHTPGLIISAHNLHCERNERLLFANLSFELHSGQVLQVAGANGSGKTTLLRTVCGLYDNHDGDIRWHGAEADMPDAPDTTDASATTSDWESFLESLLYIGHHAAVNKVLTPVENLRWNCGLQQQVSDAAILKALHEVNLQGFEDSRCHTLSAGQQQRVSLARLLLCPARLWVLDEPFTTLDAAGIAWLEQLLQQQAEQGGAIMVTSHHPLNLSDITKLTL